MFVLQLIHFNDIVHAPLTCRHTSKIVTETGELFDMVLFQLYWHWYQRQGEDYLKTTIWLQIIWGPIVMVRRGINPLKNEWWRSYMEPASQC